MTDLHPNATLVKFGYPHSLIHQGRHWAVLVRPSQPTLGSLVLCSLGEQTSYAELSADAFVEQKQLVARIEQTLKAFSEFARINYLMLMMVDPHVHFHVIPRYAGERQFEGVTITDHGWPAFPDLTNAVPSPKGLVEAIGEAWAAADRQEGSS